MATATVPLALPRTQSAACALVLDPRTPQDFVFDVIEAFATPQTFDALLRRPGRTHPAVVAAASGIHHDCLHYAIKDASSDVLDIAIELVRNVALWEAVAPAIASAPAARPAQLEALLAALPATAAPDVLIEDIRQEVTARLES